MRSFEIGDVIIRQGDELGDGDVLFFILNGSCEVRNANRTLEDRQFTGGIGRCAGVPSLLPSLRRQGGRSAQHLPIDISP